MARKAALGTLVRLVETSAATEELFLDAKMLPLGEVPLNHPSNAGDEFHEPGCERAGYS